MDITTSEYYVGLGFSSERAETLAGHVCRALVDTDLKVDVEILDSAFRTFAAATAGKGFGGAVWAAGLKDAGEQGSGRDYKKLVYNAFRSQFWSSADGTRVTVDGTTAPKRVGKTAWAKPSAFTGEAVSTALMALVRRVTAIEADWALPDRLVDSVGKLSADIADINLRESARRIALAVESVEAKRLAASPVAQAANLWQRLSMVASMYDAMPAAAKEAILAGARAEVTDAQRADADFCETLRIASKNNPFVELVLSAPVAEAAQ